MKISGKWCSSGPVPGPELLNTSTKCTLRKLAADAKLWGVVDTPERWDAIHRNLDRLEQWAQVNLVRFNKSKCKTLHLGQDNPHYQYKLGDDRIESSSAKKYLGVLVDG